SEYTARDRTFGVDRPDLSVRSDILRSMTSTWDARFDGHALWSAVDTLTEHLRNCDTPDQSNELDHLNRLRKLAGILGEHKNSDQGRDLYTDRMLTGVHSALANSINPEIEIYAKDRVNTSHLQNAATNCDIAFDTIAGWPPLPATGYAQAAGRAFKEYEKSAKSSMDELNELYRETDSKYKELEKRFQLAQDKIDGQSDEFATSLEAREAQYLEAISQVEQSGREAYDKSIREHVDSQASHLTDLNAIAANTLLETQEYSNKALEAWKATEQAATWLSERAIATDFGKQARNKAVAGWAYDLLAATVAAVPLTLVLVHFLTAEPDSGSAISVTIARASVTIGALIVAGILFSRGATNHREARLSKSADIRLGTLEAFISKLGADEAAIIRQGMAENIYLKGTLADEQTPDRTSLLPNVLPRRSRNDGQDDQPSPDEN
ncbi:MAG: hypothetical protein WAW17_30305, partial [Rhodococcus sp. (in: high G+C Gram-positive bacteria)]|uniref:hypothetical protein n=1 Tax=Rhodococcus sp. TaxID=1831 RepID=UPI003BAFA75F